MVRRMEKGQWNPYMAGALSGLVIVGSVWLNGKYAGASTTFVRSVGMIEEIFSPERIAQMEYFLKEKPIVDWQWMFVLGILIGSLIAALTSDSFKSQAVPDMWQAKFGPSPIKRGLAAFVGGIIAMYGARLADGCPSGHGLSGSLQLAVSGYVALLCFFIGGILMARLVYGKGGKS